MEILRTIARIVLTRENYDLLIEQFPRVDSLMEKVDWEFEVGRVIIEGDMRIILEIERLSYMVKK